MIKMKPKTAASIFMLPQKILMAVFNKSMIENFVVAIIAGLIAGLIANIIFYQTYLIPKEKTNDLIKEYQILSCILDEINKNEAILWQYGELVKPFYISGPGANSGLDTRKLREVNVDYILYPEHLDFSMKKAFSGNIALWSKDDQRKKPSKAIDSIYTHFDNYEKILTKANRYIPPLRMFKKRIVPYYDQLSLLFRARCKNNIEIEKAKKIIQKRLNYIKNRFGIS